VQAATNRFAEHGLFNEVVETRNRGDQNGGPKARVVANRQARQPRTQGDSPESDGLAPLFQQPAGEGLNINQGLKDGLKCFEKIGGEEISPWAQLARAAVKLPGKLQRRGAHPESVQLAGVAGKKEMMIQMIVPTVQKKDDGFFPPSVIATVQSSVDHIVQRVRTGAGTEETKVYRSGEFHGDGLHFNCREIKVLQQKLSLVQVQVPAVGLGHAGGGMVDGDAVNPLANKRDHDH